ncbi:MAG: NF038122 family metalloprotease [Pirellulales bacterium]
MKLFGWLRRCSPSRTLLRLEPLEARRLLSVTPGNEWSYTLKSPLGPGTIERTVHGGLPENYVAPAYVPSVNESPLMPLGTLDPDTSVGGFNIDLLEGPDLQTNPAAEAVFARAAQFWESVLSDPITVRLDVDFTSVGFSSASVVGSTDVQNLNFEYSDVRARLTYDAAPNESLVNSLPAVGALNFSLPAGPELLQLTTGGNNPVMALTRANALALGFTNLVTGTKTSAFSPGVIIDGSIKFNSAFSFDLDSSDGVSPGTIDLESVAIHEIGHALGFFSTVDVVDAVLDAGSPPTTVFPQPLDLFRLAPGQGPNFSTATRVLTTGGDQVVYDGQFDISQYKAAFAAGIPNLATGDIVMSTGRATGDTQQASHYKAGETSGFQGLMDPTINFQEILPFTQTDLRLFGLIGWDTVNNGLFAPAPTVTVTPKTTNDATPSLSGALTAGVPATASVYVGIPGALGTNSATLTADGPSTLAGAFVLSNDASSQAKIVRAELILPGVGSFGNIIPDFHMNTQTGGGAGAVTDFEAGAGEPATVGLISPVSDAVTDDGDQFNISKTLVMNFSDFNPGESISWRIDIDPGGVAGNQLAGAVLVVTWDNGLSTRGTLAAIGPANSDASTVTVVQNRAFKATNNGDGTWTLADNVLPALAAGSYDVQVTAWDESEARAQDATVNELVIDQTPPTADIVDVTPDPRSTAVSSIQIVFSEAVTGLDLADLALTRNGGPNLLTGSESLTTGDNITFTLSGLASLTGVGGNYALTLTAAGSGITDTAGNALVANASDAWVVDTSAPTADIVDVTPDPRSTAVSSIQIVFSEAVTGFNLADLALTRNGGPNLLTGGESLTTGDNITFTLSGLTALTGNQGTYTLALTAAGSGITDTSSNALAADASDAWSMTIVEAQAENFSSRTSGNGHQWSIVDQEVAGVGSFTGATGPGSDFLQALTLAGQDSPQANVAPAVPSVDYVVQIATPGIYDLKLRVAGVSSSSDSLWAQVTTGSLFNAQGNSLTSGALQIATNITGSFTDASAGRWELGAGTHTIRISMRESGAAIDRLQLVPLAPVAINGTTEVQAEAFARRQSASGHSWLVVDQETAGVGAFTGATGPALDYVQALTTAGQDSATVALAPSATYIEYAIQVPTAGVYDLKLRTTGPSGTSDSLWVEVPSGSLFDAQANPIVSGGLNVATGLTSAFALRNAGRWELSAGTHTIRISMRESGAALDALQIVPPAATPIVGTTVIQAESFTRRQSGNGHQWSVVDQETVGTGGFSGATGPALDYVQALTPTFQDSASQNNAPAAPSIEYDIVISAAGVYQLDLRAAGISGTSDSLWIEAPTGLLRDAQGNSFAAGALQIQTNSTGVFTLQNAGRWEFAAGTHTIRISMAESGAAVDSLQIAAVAPVSISGTTTIQAEDFVRRLSGNGHQWAVVDQDLPGVGSFTGATGAAQDFLQSLTLAGQDSATTNVAPAAPWVEYSIQVATAGIYDLKARVAGISSASDSLWIGVPTGSLFNAQGNSVSSGSLQIGTNSTGAFTLVNAGRWELAAGTHTIRISMRESGAAIDALQISPPTPTVIAGTTTIQAEDFSRRASGNGHQYWVADQETPGVGSFTGATGPSADFVQALTMAAADSPSAVLSPGTPFVEFDITVGTAGVYELKLRVAGISTSSDSLFVEAPTGTLQDAQGNPTVGSGLQIATNITGAFELRSAGRWTLSAGLNRIRISMRESGAAIDSLQLAQV